MRTIPRWFEKDLAIIDPSYYVFYNDLYDYFEIKRRMDVSRKVAITEEKLRHVRVHNPTVAVFKILNDAALLDLRKRKYIGLKFHRAYKDDAYLDWLVAQNREAKKKKQELAHEMMAEGFMEMHRLQTRHTVSGRPNNDTSGSSDSRP